MKFGHFFNFFSTVPTCNLTLIRYLPGFWQIVLLSLILPSLTLSICLLPQISYILFSRNLICYFPTSHETYCRLGKDQLSNIPLNLQPLSYILNNVVFSILISLPTASITPLKQPYCISMNFLISHPSSDLCIGSRLMNALNLNSTHSPIHSSQPGNLTTYRIRVPASDQ